MGAGGGAWTYLCVKKRLTAKIVELTEAIRNPCSVKS